MNPFDEVHVDASSYAYLDLIGQDRWNAWTLVRVGWTDVGTPTVTGRWQKKGKVCLWQGKIVPATTTLTTAGTSYIVLPIAARGFCGPVHMYNSTTNIAVGTGGIDVTNSRAYLPTVGATSNTLSVSGWFEI